MAEAVFAKRRIALPSGILHDGDAEGMAADLMLSHYCAIVVQTGENTKTLLPRKNESMIRRR
ncbi:hypothetical protein DBV14_07005 [Variovorax sp. KBW07]|nr:hypothetical protein DBV14_07005 [Variovorax sp. KBW07]